MPKIISSSSWTNDSGYRVQRKTPQSSEQKVKRIVFKWLLLIFFIYLVYLFLFSKYFVIEEVNITVEDPDFNIENFTFAIREYLADSKFIIFKNNNYFLFSKRDLANSLNKGFLIEDLAISKKFPNKLNVSFSEKITNLIFETQANNYLIDLQGKINHEVGDRVVLSEKILPKIVNEADESVNLNQYVLSPSLIQLIIDLGKNFNNYISNDITIDYFKVSTVDANFVKIVTNKGFEIHLTDNLSVEEQLEKLSASLNNDLINLNNISYINLRIKEQIIYK